MTKLWMFMKINIFMNVTKANSMLELVASKCKFRLNLAENLPSMARGKELTAERPSSIVTCKIHITKISIYLVSKYL